MQRKKYLLACLVMLAIACGSGPLGQVFSARAAVSSQTVYQDWKDQKRNRTIPVKLYLPNIGKPPFPVVIFSHGLGGSRDGAEYLGQYWSEHGYLGVFVQHAGSDSGVWKPAIGQGREGIMQAMKEAANGKNLVDRDMDIKFVLDELARRNQQDPEFKGQMDLSRIAMTGHSFGAGTSLAIAGQSLAGKNTGMGDERVKAAIYLCPPVMGAGKTESGSSYGTIKMPGMLLTGTEDNSPIRDTKAEDRRIPYDGMKAPHQYLINFVGADHATFGGRSFRTPKGTDAKFHEMIEMVSTKFLDAYVKDEASARAWLDGPECKTYLGKTAMFERK